MMLEASSWEGSSGSRHCLVFLSKTYEPCQNEKIPKNKSPPAGKDRDPQETRRHGGYTTGGSGNPRLFVPSSIYLMQPPIQVNSCELPFVCCFSKRLVICTSTSRKYINWSDFMLKSEVGLFYWQTNLFLT